MMGCFFAPAVWLAYGSDSGGGVVVGPTGAIEVFGTPQTFDSVVLINLSVGSHIGFWLGVTWAWLTLIMPISNTALVDSTTTAIASNDDNDDVIPTDLIVVVFIFPSSVIIYNTSNLIYLVTFEQHNSYCCYYLNGSKFSFILYLLFI